MERLVLLLEQASAFTAMPSAPDLYVVNRGEAAEVAALLVARSLRLQGLHVEVDAGGAAFGKQFKRADRSGAPWAAILGEEELATGVVHLKPLRGQQRAECSVPLDDLPRLVAAIRP
jgi:histidyl-tRNA synthetase